MGTHPHKGKRYGGRAKGVPNKVKRDIAVLAQDFGPTCIALLAEIAVSGDTDAARTSALRELLNRGYGMPSQVMNLSVAGNINIELVSFAGLEAKTLMSVPRGKPNGHQDTAAE